jgi:hypothetical protein
MWRTRCSMLSSLIGLAFFAGLAAPAAAAITPLPVYAVPPLPTILVILSGTAPPQWVVAPDSVLPPGADLAAAMPAAMARLIADQEADLARFAAAAEALTAAPNRALETALSEMPRLGPGEASGVVMTTAMTGRGSCSETVTYSYPGNGAAPRVAVRKTGNACPAGSPFATGSEPGVIPTMRPHAPRLLDASGPSDRLIPTGPAPQTELVSYPPAR